MWQQETFDLSLTLPHGHLAGTRLFHIGLQRWLTCMQEKASPLRLIFGWVFPALLQASLSLSGLLCSKPVCHTVLISVIHTRTRTVCNHIQPCVCHLTPSDTSVDSSGVLHNLKTVILLFSGHCGPSKSLNPRQLWCHYNTGELQECGSSWLINCTYMYCIVLQLPPAYTLPVHSRKLLYKLSQEQNHRFCVCGFGASHCLIHWIRCLVGKVWRFCSQLKRMKSRKVVWLITDELHSSKKVTSHHMEEDSSCI